MITTMFYYNYYKPYIFKSKKMDKMPEVQKRQEDTTAKVSSVDNKRLLLNKALNNDVVSYAHSVSHNLTSLKDSTKYINYDINDFETNKRKYGAESTKKLFKSDIETFVNAYNKAYSFYSGQKHSQSLVDFSIGIDNTIISNTESLEEIGISIDENNLMTFSPEKYDELDIEELKHGVENSKQAFESLYSQSSSMLTVPLAEHMNFKKFNYYYNYKFGGLVSDTFKIIEAGLIIDKIV